MIYDGHALAGFLPVCSTRKGLQEEEGTNDEEISVYGFASSLTLLLERSKPVIEDSEMRERQWRVLSRSYESSSRSLQKSELRGFVLSTRELVEWKCVLILTSYGCNIHEAKDMSPVRHCVEGRCSRIRCMVTGDDIISAKMDRKRSVRVMKMSGNHFPEIR